MATDTIGYMASVLRVGTLRPGMSIDVIPLTDIDQSAESVPAWNDVESAPGVIAYRMLAGPVVG